MLVVQTPETQEQCLTWEVLVMAEPYTADPYVGSSATQKASEKSRWQSVASSGVERRLCD